VSLLKKKINVKKRSGINIQAVKHVVVRMIMRMMIA